MCYTMYTFLFYFINLFKFNNNFPKLMLETNRKIGSKIGMEHVSFLRTWSCTTFTSFTSSSNHAVYCKFPLMYRVIVSFYIIFCYVYEDNYAYKDNTKN